MSETQTTLPLTAARKRGYVAAQACADAADRRDPAWSEKAYLAFVDFAESRGATPFTTEDARKYAATVNVPEAPDERAWGAIAQRVKREGIIRPVGYRPVESSNGSPKVLWQTIPHTSP